MTAPLLRDAPDNRLRWALVWVPIGVWAAHLTFEAAMVHETCSHPGLRWTLYAGTVVPAGIVLGAIALAVRALRQSPNADLEGATEDDQVAFLAYLGLVMGIVSLILIIAEGIVVPFVSSCA
jgi:hypothetical protein